MKKLTVLYAIYFCLIASYASADLMVGDVSIIGYGADNDDQFTFVVWKDLTAGSVLTFTDNGFDGSAFRTTEGTVLYTVPVGGYSLGTTVKFDSGAFDDGGSATVSSFSLSTSGDQIFVFDGDFSSESFDLGKIVYGFSGNGSWGDGSPTAQFSALPAQLNSTDGNIAIGESDQYDYNSTRDNGTPQTPSFYKNLIANTANYTTNNTRFSLSSADFSVTAVPEPSAFLFGGLVCCMAGLAYGGRSIVGKLRRQS